MLKGTESRNQMVKIFEDYAQKRIKWLSTTETNQHKDELIDAIKSLIKNNFNQDGSLKNKDFANVELLLMRIKIMIKDDQIFEKGKIKDLSILMFDLQRRVLIEVVKTGDINLIKQVEGSLLKNRDPIYTPAMTIDYSKVAQVDKSYRDFREVLLQSRNVAVLKYYIELNLSRFDPRTELENAMFSSQELEEEIRGNLFPMLKDQVRKSQPSLDTKEMKESKELKQDQLSFENLKELIKLYNKNGKERYDALGLKFRPIAGIEAPALSHRQEHKEASGTLKPLIPKASL